MRTKEQMYEDIVNWEREAGEDFVDYFSSSINEFNFMFWALGKGYITEEQLQAYEEETIPSTHFLLGDEEYSVVQDSEENWEEPYKKSRRILADFLTSTITYQTRIDEFFKDITPLNFEDALKEYRFKREKVFYEIDGQRIYLTDETPITVEILKEAKWYRDDNE